MLTLSEKLKELIEKNGPDYLTREPYGVYTTIVAGKFLDVRTAAALLHTFVMHIPDLCQEAEELHRDTVIRQIQDSCYLNEKVSAKLADIYLELYSAENAEEWEKLYHEGLSEFLNETLEIFWTGEAEWKHANNTMSCSYDGSFELRPVDEKKIEKILSDHLEENPFLSFEAIAEIFTDRVTAYLDSEFEDYCGDYGYYPPVVEDFELKKYLEDWCEDYGFQLVSADGSGSIEDDDAEEYFHW